MTPEALADIHAQSISVPPPWSAATFATFLKSPGIILVTREAGFALGRVVVDEAELLTLAVLPDARRSGHGRAGLSEFERQAAKAGALRAFLEVSASNTGALALYRSAGYVEDGTRAGYYASVDGTRLDAILMSKPLVPT